MKKLFLFDIDGTIAIDETLLDGTADMLKYIDDIGGRAMYITNNSTKSREDYVRKFLRWGIKTECEDFITATYAACRYLADNYRDKKIFTVGTESFCRELRANGFRITQTPDNDTAAVLVGFDNELTYSKVENACRLLFRPEIDFLATNPDLCCPTAFGSVPDCGAICRMINCAVNRAPLFLGKPNPLMVNACMEISGFSAEETIVVGDRLYTDIAAGINAGVDTALVFTGEAKPEDISCTDFMPAMCFDNIRTFYDTISGRKGEA